MLKISSCGSLFLTVRKSTLGSFDLHPLHVECGDSFSIKVPQVFSGVCF